jgi:uncharacterized coiled-coil protein SlyX
VGSATKFPRTPSSELISEVNNTFTLLWLEEHSKMSWFGAAVSAATTTSKDSGVSVSGEEEGNLVMCCLDDLRAENEILRSKLFALQAEASIGKGTTSTDTLGSLRLMGSAEDDTDCTQDEETLLHSPSTLLSKAQFLEDALNSSERELRTARRKRSVLLKELTQKEEAMRLQSAAAQCLAVQGRGRDQEIVSLNAKLVELLPLQLQLAQSRQSVQALSSQCRANALELERSQRERGLLLNRATEAEQQLQTQQHVQLQLSESQALVHTLQAELVILRQAADLNITTVTAHKSATLVSEERNSQLTAAAHRMEREQDKLRALVERLQISDLAAKQKAQKDEAQGYSQAQLWERVQCIQLRNQELGAALKIREEEDEEEQAEKRKRGGRRGFLSLIPVCGAYA